MTTPLDNTKSRRVGKKTRRGAVAIMALLIVVIMVILFQTYMTHVLSDMKTGSTFDNVSQYNGERMAVGNLVKEGILQYYERPRLGQAVPATLSTLIQDYLTEMQTGSITYTVSSIDAFPTNTATVFWPLIPNASTAGVNTAIDASFNLHSVSLPSDLAKSGVAQFFGDSSATALEVQTAAGGDLFKVDVTRATGGTTDTVFKFYVRLFQVPVTNFNLIAYAITENANNIPATPPTLGGNINLANLNALALSKMNQNGINLNGGASTTAYPYMYRELFSAAASAWEYAFYTNSNFNYIVTDLMKDSADMYMLMDPYSGDVYKQVGSGATATTVSCSNPDGSTGFDPEYMYRGATGTKTTVDVSGYRVTSTGGYITINASGQEQETGLLYTNGSAAADYNGDGVINHNDVDAQAGASGVFHLPNELNWTINLDKIGLINAASVYRRIYVHLPDVLGTILHSTITIRDSATGVAASPVIVCVEGWSRANTIIKTPAATIPANYQIYLDGTLTDQQILLYTVGTDVLLKSGTHMDGVLLFDDKLAGFNRNLFSFDFRGLIAWSGSSASIGINESYITVAPLPAGTDNQFRSVVPRFLLADVRGETQLP